MSPTQGLFPIPSLESRVADSLRHSLFEAGFTDRELPHHYGLSTLAQMRSLTPEQRDRRLADEPTPARALIRLFLHGSALPRDQLSGLPNIDELISAGFLASHGNDIIATVNLVPFMGLLIASDRSRDPAGRRVVHEQHVMGIGGSSLTLASLTIRRPIGRALDLGCGCGVHALLAARHAGLVIATDLSERAVAFTRLNSLLNGIDNIDARAGDLYDPAGDDAFDLIVSNPPFVISPETSFVYRDSPLPGDELVRRVVTGAAQRLSPGGFASILANWIHPRGGSWETRLTGWIAPAGCDGLVMQSMASSGEEYARKWIEHTGVGADLEADVARWTAYFDEQGVEAIGSGLIVLRRPAAERPPAFVTAHAPDNWTAGEHAGEHLVGLLDAAAWLDAASDEAVLAAHLSIAPEARLEQEFVPTEDGWALEQATMRLHTGLAARARLDGFVARLVTACGPPRAIGEAVDEVAQDFGADPAQARQAALPVLRGLIRAGYLKPPVR